MQELEILTRTDKKCLISQFLLRIHFYMILQLQLLVPVLKYCTPCTALHMHPVLYCTAHPVLYVLHTPSIHRCLPADCDGSGALQHCSGTADSAVSHSRSKNTLLHLDPSRNPSQQIIECSQAFYICHFGEPFFISFIFLSWYLSISIFTLVSNNVASTITILRTRNGYFVTNSKSIDRPKRVVQSSPVSCLAAVNQPHTF